MAPRKFNYLFIATSALLLISAAQTPQAEARKYVGVNPFCRTATWRRICTQMVNGAANLHDASANAMKTTLDLARRVRGLLPLLDPALVGLDPESRESALKTCTENFDDIVDDLEVSLQAFEAADIENRLRNRTERSRSRFPA